MVNGPPSNPLLLLPVTTTTIPTISRNQIFPVYLKRCQDHPNHMVRRLDRPLEYQEDYYHHQVLVLVVMRMMRMVWVPPF